MALAAYNDTSMTLAGCIHDVCFYRGFSTELRFFDSGLYTCTAVACLTLALAKLSCLLQLPSKSFNRLIGYLQKTNQLIWINFDRISYNMRDDRQQFALIMLRLSHGLLTHV